MLTLYYTLGRNFRLMRCKQSLNLRTIILLGKYAPKVISYVLLVGIVMALSTILMLAKDKFASTIDKILAVFAGAICLHLAIKFYIFTSVNNYYVRHSLLTFLNLFYVPLIYLLVLKATNPQLILHQLWYIFMPCQIYLVFYFSVIAVQYFAPVEGQLMLYWYAELGVWCISIVDVCFALLSLKHINKIPDIHLKKLASRLVYIFLILGLMPVLSKLYFYITRQDTEYVMRIVGYSTLTLTCILISRYKFNFLLSKNYHNETSHNEKLALIATKQEQTVAESNFELEEVENTENKKPIISEQEMYKVWLQLENEMSDKKIFINNELSLDKLAQATQINKYHISQTLNYYVKKNFYQYINEFRVNYIVEKLQSFKQMNLDINFLSLAYEAGFNSKSSFNRYFKDITGVTPSEYFQNLNNHR